MGLLDDMLTNTDDYEQILTHSALNILEEIRMLESIPIKRWAFPIIVTELVS